MKRALVLSVAFAAACDHSPQIAPPPDAIVDLTASLQPLRHAFDADRGEPRFLALLSPG